MFDVVDNGCGGGVGFELKLNNSAISSKSSKFSFVSSK